ncbi:FAD-dependent pyridine nucleotide-disulfide oxidoreductase [Desulforamulus reducens MI-1]|uniref:FAD-dependent pyridine nucleotide-disulfide oxidoreductase n=1 Tax=Desulforamulus reducens (strain ATCC BAA-1160 / DSM 100696 / MI-1) TaxID=349161 RepID=A4J3D6_DESRM|nr:FAD-dependent oxidoreductase [Desulforamulus reducens]ABO49589.1 FAD-dependent pyridine nucleotide-disulfide oxidoreductase [Desulforamulus reducens MI-1]
MASKKILIIGGVAAGPKTAARARRLDPEAQITILEKGKYISYAGCGMPFYLSGKIHDFDHLYSTSYGVKRDPEFFKSERGVDVFTGVEAISIDRTNKKVVARDVETGEEKIFEYDKLVLGTGSNPITPPIENLDLKGVYRLNHLTDAAAIKQALDAGEVNDVVVIGTGFIGMEAVDAIFSPRRTVTVVEFRETLLPGILDPDMGKLLYKSFYEQGLEGRFGEKVLKLEGEDGRVSKVITDKGSIDADAVILAVGVRPNVKLAQDAGLTIGETGAIAVNEYMETSDPDIYALGDCAENTNLLTGKKVFAPMATYANRQGRVVGDNVTGRKSTFKGILGTGVLHCMDMNVARTGLGEVQARALGYDIETITVATFDMTHYHPNSNKIVLKMIAEKGTQRILGIQGLGKGEVAKRADVVAALIQYGGTLDDLLNVDLGYAPPYNTPIDPMVHAGNALKNKLEGIANTYTPAEVQAKLEKGDDFVLLDVRTAQQFNMRYIEDERTKQLALGELRQKLAEVPKDKEIVTVCVMGSRAYEAARILEGAGFNNVKFMEAGMEGWPFDMEDF